MKHLDTYSGAGYSVYAGDKGYIMQSLNDLVQIIIPPRHEKQLPSAREKLIEVCDDVNELEYKVKHPWRIIWEKILWGSNGRSIPKM